MLDLLHRDLLCDRSQQNNIKIKTTHFIENVTEAFLNQDKGMYQTRRFQHIHKQGECLVSGVHTSLGFTANCNSNHWVAVILESRTKKILYRDSLGKAMSRELQAILRWWTNEHTETQFTVDKLPITHQIDTISCGLLAWNALAHFSLPQKYLLISPTRVAAEQLQMLLCICSHHQDSICDSQSVGFDC
jgi:hypothetical protein